MIAAPEDDTPEMAERMERWHRRGAWVSLIGLTVGAWVLVLIRWTHQVPQ